MASFPITELPNELTTDIDVASPGQVVRLLAAAEEQVFRGYRGCPAIGDDRIIAKIAQVIRWMAPLAGRRDAVIVISGAGTSGRIAMLAAPTFNRFLVRRQRHPNVRYLIAGGDRALIKAQEGAEDDPHQAWRDLLPILRGKRRVLYIGITCALAAPYVAGQLWRLSRRSQARCVLIGFNPVQSARATEIENWDKTFADVVAEIAPMRNCLILNPIVGPEAITGSTRMKGGSVTKLLLETIFALAVREAGIAKGPATGLPLAEAVRQCLRAYDRTRTAAYAQAGDIASLIALGGQALRGGGHIYYLGAGSPGILGILDASECPPTFGADFDDVRGFVAGGWRTLLGPGRDLSSEGPWYRIALDDFVAEHLPHLTGHDLIVGLPSAGLTARLRDVLGRCRKASAMTAVVCAGPSTPPIGRLDTSVCVDALPRTILPGAGAFQEYATKLILNALTTGAHVLDGKVYQNRMVDLRISNTKLYHRAIGIIQHVMGANAETAKRCLLRSIYGLDRVPPALMRAKPSQHVLAATNTAKVTPKALILAGTRSTCAQAERVLQAEPVVRAAIERLRGRSR